MWIYLNKNIQFNLGEQKQNFYLAALQILPLFISVPKNNNIVNNAIMATHIVK